MTLLTDTESPEQVLINAFHLMYDNFPEAAMLVHKSKRIVALNEGAKTPDRIPGKICAKLGAPEMHAGCLAYKALSEQRAMYSAVSLNGRSLIVYWLPINGHPDYYIHFSVGNRDYSS